MTGRFGGILVLPIHPRAGEPAGRVLVHGIKGSRAPLQLLPGLVLHDAGKGFRPEIEAVLRHGAPLPLTIRTPPDATANRPSAALESPCGWPYRAGLPILWGQRASRGSHAVLQSQPRRSGSALFRSDRHGDAPAARSRAGLGRRAARESVQPVAAADGGRGGELAGRLAGAVASDLQPHPPARRREGQEGLRVLRGRRGLGRLLLALAGDEIYADPSSIVGSIGVVSASFGLDKFINRFGIERRVHTAGKDKGALDPFQPERPEDVARLKDLQRDVHDVFIGVVKSAAPASSRGRRRRCFPAPTGRRPRRWNTA